LRGTEFALRRINRIGGGEEEDIAKSFANLSGTLMNSFEPDSTWPNLACYFARGPTGWGHEKKHHRNQQLNY
jgi:hypothetical protein